MFATTSMILNLPSSYWFRISGLELSDEGREFRPFHMVGKNLGKSYNCTSSATRIVLASFETKNVPEMSSYQKWVSVWNQNRYARPRLLPVMKGHVLFLKRGSLASPVPWIAHVTCVSNTFKSVCQQIHIFEIFWKIETISRNPCHILRTDPNGSKSDQLPVFRSTNI